MCVTITSKSTCAQGKSRSSPLGPRNKLRTLWQRRSRITPSSNIASPCVDNNPRCPSNWVWGILYYSTYVTAVFRIRIVLYQSKSPARVFARYPFWDFTWLELDVPSLFSQRILVNLELWLYLEFKCGGARIANATISPVSWALRDLRIVEPKSS